MADHCHAECRYAECRVLFIFMLNVVMPSVVAPRVGRGVLGTLVEHSPHHPKVEGLSPATANGTGREEMTIQSILAIFL
jgi:hypothetical protein